MDAIASQITSLTIVYSIVYSDADQTKHERTASLAFVRRIHRGPVNSPHKWPVTRKMFPFDDVIMRLRKCLQSYRLQSHRNTVRGIRDEFLASSAPTRTQTAWGRYRIWIKFLIMPSRTGFKYVRTRFLVEKMTKYQNHADECDIIYICIIPQYNPYISLCYNRPIIMAH